MSALFSFPAQRAIDDSGNVMPGAKLYFYETETTTPKASYQDSGLVTAHSNPVVADAFGVFPAIWLNVSTGAYRVTLTDAGGVVEWTVDGIDTEAVVAPAATVDVHPVTDDETALGIIPVNTNYPVGNVLRYGVNTVPGTTDMASYIQMAWDVISRTGGEVVIPPGQYLCGATLQFYKPIVSGAPAATKVTVSGYGAELFAGPSVTGFAIEIYRYYNQFGTQIEGIRFNHRANATVLGCVKVYLSSHYIIRDCNVEFGQNISTYRAIEVGPAPGGTSDTNSFWGLIEGFGTRLRSVADGPAPDTAILLRGAANSTTIRNCAINNVRDGVVLEPDGNSYLASHATWPSAATYWLEPGVKNETLANSVRIYDNAFEAMSGAAVKVVAEKVVSGVTYTSQYGPAGLYIGHNRIEDLGSVLEFSGNPPSVGDHSHPPIVENNYAVNGYSTQYIVNPNSERYFSVNPHYFFDGSAFPAGQGSRVGGTGDYVIEISDSQPGNFILRDYSGFSTYNSAHLVLGTYHLWVDTGTGKLMIKNGAPASAGDGTIVGTQT